MAMCIQLVPQEDGSFKIYQDSVLDNAGGGGGGGAPSLSAPSLQSCPLVIQSGAEIGNSLFDLTPPQALEISGFVAGLWALAWVFKQIAKTLNIGDSHDE